MDTAQWAQGIGSVSSTTTRPQAPPPPPPPTTTTQSAQSLSHHHQQQLVDRRARPVKEQALPCPRCNSTNTKFCYYNNYSLTQPRYFCKTCRRYWTEGGSLRNVPVGGGSRKNKRHSTSSSTTKLNPNLQAPPATMTSSSLPISAAKHYQGQDLSLTFPDQIIGGLNFPGNSNGGGGLSAMELLTSTGITPRGLGPLGMHMPMPETSAALYGAAGFGLHDFKFPLDGNGNGHGMNQRDLRSFDFLAIFFLIFYYFCKDRDSAMVNDDKSSIPMRDRELLIPVGGGPDIAGDGDSKASSSGSAAAHHHHSSGREAFYKVIRSWASKKFMTGCVILFPIAITFYITWWFIRFVDGFFSPIYTQLGINIFGLGFITSISFIFLVGVFMSSWLGASVLSLGEWFIKRMPFVRHIYNASKQISSAISPNQNTQAFKEVAIIRHPRIGEYAIGFITSSVVLQSYSGEEELCCVYVPTNHLYIGDVFLVNSQDIIRPNLSVREGIEIVVSVGMSMPQVLSTLEPTLQNRTRSIRS